MKVKTVTHGKETRGTKAKKVSTKDKLAGKLKAQFNKALGADSKFGSLFK